MVNYLVKLKPINNFFFGGDITFGNLGDEENSSYFVKSRYFPQQTAILGLIRRQLLVQKGLLTKKVKGEWVTAQKKDDSVLNTDNSKDYKYQKNELIRDEAIKLVGIGQFDIDSNLDLGIINKISPVFIIKGNECFFQLNEFGEFNKKSDEKEMRCFIDNKEKDFIPILEGFKSKDGVLKNLVSASNKISIDNVFKEVEQIGNNKKEEENSLYKKTSYKFLDNFEFAFILELSEECNLDESIVSLGGDNSNFRMVFEKKDVNYNFDEITKTLKLNNNTITLFSDAYIKENVLDYCDFAVNSIISFQNLRPNYIKDNKRNSDSNMVFSDKKYFYERGSVFFNPKYDNTYNFDTILKKDNLQKIGYNIFKKGDNNGK